MRNKVLFKQGALWGKLQTSYPQGNVRVTSGLTERPPRDNREKTERRPRVAHEWLKYAAMFVMLLTVGSGNVWGQGTESFENLSSATSYGSRSWTGTNGQTGWAATNARTDQKTAGSRGLTFKASTASTITMKLTSAQQSAGLGVLTFKYKYPYSDSGKSRELSITIGGNTYSSGTLSYTASATTGTITVNQSLASATVTINVNNGAGRICVDEFSWTSNAPACTAPNHVDISGNWDKFGGETINLTAAAYSSAGTGSQIADANITGWQWQKLVGSTWTNVSNGTVNGSTTSGATTKNLQITNCTKDHSGKYRCVVSTGATCSTASATKTDGTEGYGVKVYVLECYTGGTTVYNFTRDGNNQRGSVEVTLSASTAYAFKVHGDTEYYGNNGTVNEDITNWVMCNDGTAACNTNLTVNSGLGGTFTFTMDYSSGGNNSTVGVPELSITYPRKTIYLIPNSDWLSNSAKFAYYYYSASGANDWTDFIAANACGMTADIPQWNGITVIAVRFNSSEASPGWNGDGHVWNQTDDIALTADKNLITITGWNNSQTYGTYSPTTYQITFAGNGNSSGSMTNVTSIPCGEDRTLAANAFVKTGHTFANWKTNVAITVGGSPVAADGAVANQATINNITSDITLTAQWNVNSHTLTWNWNGGSTSSTTYTLYPATSGSVNYGASITKPANNTMSKTGYNFTSWSSNATTMPDDNLTIAANWTAKTYDLTLDPDGGSGSNQTVTATYDATMPTTLKGGGAIVLPTKTGYTFGGYYSAKNGGGTQYYTNTGASARTWNVDDEITLYAKWTINSHILTWNWGGGSCSGTAGTHYTAGGSLNYGTAISYPDDSYMSKAGYTFTGWSSDATTMPDDDLTITAQWTPKTDTYKTALHTSAAGWTTYASGHTESGGGYTIPNPGSVAKGATSTCEDTHYHFAGWVTDANKEAGTISGNIIAATGTTDATGTTYWAVWEKESAGGGSTQSEVDVIANDGSYAGTPNVNTYSAISGNITLEQIKATSGTAVNTTYSEKGSSPNRPRVYQYQTIKIEAASGYKIDSVAITYNSTKYGNGLTANTSINNDGSVTDNTTNVTKTTSTDSGGTHQFKINTEGGASGLYIQNAGSTNVQWHLAAVNVTYTYSSVSFEDPKVECEACAATPSITSVDLTSGIYSLTSVPVQATGASAGTNCSISSYGFYWGTSENPTGNSTASTNLNAGTFSATLTGSFTVGVEYHYRAFATNNGSNTGYSSDATFTLRQVSFNLHGHGSAVDAQIVPNGGKASAPSAPSEEGWVFGGWYDNSSYSGSAWDFSSNTVSGANVELHAKWTERVAVTFNVPTGVDKPSNSYTDVALPTPTGFPSAVDDDCWAFAGWTESSSVNSTDAPATLYPAGSIYNGSQTSAFNLYAVYSRNKYLVVYDNAMLEAGTDYIISTWESDNYAIIGVADGNNAEVVDMDDNFHDKELGGLHYYTLDNPSENAVWHLTGSTDSWVLQNKATGKYLDLSSTSSPMIANASATLSITEGTGEDAQTYKLTKSSNHLVISSSGASVATGDATYYFLYKLLSSKYMTTPADPTYTVTWKVSGESDQTTIVNACEGLTAEQISALTIPDDDHLEVTNGGCIPNTKGKFMGWSATNLGSEDGQGAPADLFTTAANAPYLTKDTTLYAVFAEASGGGTPYYGKVTSTGDITNDGRYLIVSEGGIEDGKVPAFKGSLASLDATADTIQVTISEDKIDVNSITEANEFTIDVTNKYVKSASNKYINADRYANELDSNTDPTAVHSISIDGGNLIIEGSGTDNNVNYDTLKYNKASGQKRFRFYKTGQENVQLYKYNPGVSYSNYRTSCCATTITFDDPTITGNGTVVYRETSGVPTCEGDTSVTVTITPAAGYQASAITFGGTAARTDTLPAVSTPLTAAQAYKIGYAQGVSGTLITAVTFEAKPLTDWAWKYKKDADITDGSVEPYDIPATVEIYKDQYARFIITGYTPSDVIAEKQGYVYTSGGVEPYYSTDYLARVAGTASYFTLRGKAPVESTTITFKAIGDASITKTITIKVNALPAVHFTDIVHGESFADVAASVTTGVVTFTNTTPTHADIAAPGSSNSCENGHLHLVGWIYSEWSGVADYMDNTGDAPDTDELRAATVGIADGFAADDTPCYFEAGASIDTQVWNGKTFYAVWARVE